VLGFLKQLGISAVNLKDVKDHLPSDPQQEAAALADYAAAGIKPHAAGTVYFDKNEDADIRNKFEYCKRAGIPSLSPAIPPWKLCRELKSSYANTTSSSPSTITGRKISCGTRRWMY